MSTDGSSARKSPLVLVSSGDGVQASVPAKKVSHKKIGHLSEGELERLCDEFFEDISLDLFGRYYGGLCRLNQMFWLKHKIKKPILIIIVPSGGWYNNLIELISEDLFGQDAVDSGNPDAYLHGFISIPTKEVMVCISEISPLVAVNFLETLASKKLPILMFGPDGFVKLYENFIVE